MERKWQASEQFLDFLVQEGHLEEYEQNGKEKDLLVQEMREGGDYEVRQIYARLYRQNSLSYHRWRQKQGLDD